MRITIAKHKYPEIEALPTTVAAALIDNAIRKYSTSDDYKHIVSIFTTDGDIVVTKKVNKVAPYKNKSVSNKPAVVVSQVITETLIENKSIDDNNIDIMGGFNYE